MTSAQVGQARFARRYLAPSHRHGASKHALALEVLTEILGGGTTSRLYRTMVVETKVAVSAGSWYGGDNIGPSTFGFYGSPTQGKTIEEVEAAIDREILKLLETGVTQDELATAIKRLTRSAIFALDSVTAPARIIGAALASGQSIEAIESWPERISLVTVEDVAQAARAVLSIERSVTSTLLPKDVK
jgi:zinc protease